MLSVYRLLNSDMFPTLKAIFQVALSILVSSCERSFSVLRRLHTSLRSTLGQDRLNHLAFLSIEKKTLDGQTQIKKI
ncbi:putative hAT family C-terminal dimerization region-containing protein 24 [Homarus americanus]|uniref:Putative hAT family C-terminal dimerization region-containing protein 24 n=1 Tax=Homarus americanus TaxID=6706 RepID=A0A8J5JJJ3_HOMAM|nr:putative hAT family C-terminal dimerization region-containing protein 24 [Homarus americanus]